MTVDRQLPLQPTHHINPRTQVDRMPGTDAVCEQGLTADTCRWPFCPCYSPDRQPQPEGET